MVNSPIGAQLIADHVAALGVSPGDLLIVHSALASLGRVDGGEDAVIDGLLTAVGPAGTLCMPTLTFGRYGPRHPPPLFDPVEARGRVGRIPERFRTRAGVLRSLHPTHSVAALGPRAEELLAGHDLSATPCGPESPWGRLALLRGHVLLLGVGMSNCTMFHGPEEVAEPEARCTPATPCTFATSAGESTSWLRLHRPYHGAVSKRQAMTPVLRRHGFVREGHVGAAAALLIDAHGLWELSLELLRARPSGKLDRVYAVSRSALEQVAGPAVRRARRAVSGRFV
jgi:aminoglycoside 3-N-acetyltransferase